jgi:5-formyltetrahydrofolate cyclo-ligase
MPAAEPPDPPDPTQDRRARLRQHFRRARRQLTEQQQIAHGLAVAKHWRAESVLSAGTGAVALFVAQDGEIDTGPLREQLHSTGRVVALPWIDPAGQLQFRAHRAGEALEPGRYNIPVPPASSPPVQPAALAIMVMPLVAFDAAGTRLGMGGGFYDRLLGPLAAERRPLLLGLAHSAQRAEAPLPRADWDVPLNAVLTEQGLVHFP